MKILTVYIDIVFCLVVLPLLALLSPVERWFYYFPVYMTGTSLLLYGIYFTNRLITVPFLFRGNRYRLIGLSLILLSVILVFLTANVTLYVPKPNALDNGILRVFPSVTNQQQTIWTLFALVETFSFAVGLLTETNKQRAKWQKLEEERDKARIALYKAQIKPHFMFNTLNSLYGLFLTRDEMALESLEKFISMMRYIHSTSLRDLVTLSDEVDYISEYVDLQSLRLNEMTKVELHTEINDNDIMVPPMLLVTFVENCFKHGISPVEESEISISITEHDGVLTFTTENRIFPVKREGEHMGIENCRKRLGILYPEHHSLQIDNDQITYKVKLIIELTKYEVCGNR